MTQQTGDSLTEEQRKELFLALVEAQDGGMTVPKSRKAVAERFNVSVPQVRRIENEGLEAGWPPLAAPIGSGLGSQNPNNIAIIKEFARVPVLVDAGGGTASDAAIAMELGCDGVLMNTAIAGAKDPVLMAHAMKLAVEAGRAAFKAGRIPRKRFASASSPVDGLIG